MYKIALIGIAGLTGTLVRYWLSASVDSRWDSTFPIGTVTVNLIGCFVIGLVVHAVEQKFLVDPVVRSAILVGLLGGFTTFSSFGVKTFNLLREGRAFLAVLNIVISNVGGLLCVWTGYAVLPLKH